ncbi:MAG: NUDIX hydrolase [Nevskia sp.]|nr:NUDIX hydrolase [Nevskia sp.]
MKKKRIRPLAVCVIRDRGRIFVSQCRERSSGQVYYRPLGGAIEFGERSQDAVLRELQEEVGARVTNLRYLGTLENIFTFEDEPCHEIVLVYEADFVDLAIYKKARLRRTDGSPNTALWHPLQAFHNGSAPLYPAGLLELL